MPQPPVLAYLAFDDTDTKDSTIGTGRCMRNFCYDLPEGYRLVGVLRHQMPQFEHIPFTSNNSSACAIIEMDDRDMLSPLAERGTQYLLDNFVEGSDPGICAALADEVHDTLVQYSVAATGKIMTQQDAMDAVNGFVLRGLGGTNDGIIGAAASVGLTRHGWCGRFIEYGRLRDLGDPVRVADLNASGIRAVSVDRDPLVPQPDDVVHTGGWIRPSLWGGQAVLQVRRENGAWRAFHTKGRDKSVPIR